MPRPKLPRWLTPRFSLRTLFVVVTMAGLVAWWVSAQLNWIRQRREFVANNPIVLTRHGDVRAPGLLWLFGEEGNSEVLIQVVDPWMYEKAKLAWPAELDDQGYLEEQRLLKTAVGIREEGKSLAEQAKRLYPEATRVRNTYLKADPRKPKAEPH